MRSQLQQPFLKTGGKSLLHQGSSKMPTFPAPVPENDAHLLVLINAKFWLKLLEFDQSAGSIGVGDSTNVLELST